jgi:tape measure domain-containing protein
MPNYGFTVKADGNVDEIMKKMQAAIESMGATVERTTDKVKKHFGGMGGWIKKITGDISGDLKNLLGGFLAFQGIKSFLQMGVEAEQTAMSFEVFLGSAERAKDMVGQLKKMGAVTPFETSDLTEAAKMMLNFGINADTIIDKLNMLGDASGGNAERMKGMVYAFSQMSSTGRLMGQDLLQMINAGFNPLQEMSRTTGKSMADLKKQMEKGEISVKMVEDAFKSATGPGGKFFEMMKKQSATLGGQWSTFMDSLKEPLLALFDVLAPILKSIIQNTTKAIEFLKEMFTGSSTGAKVFRTVLAALVIVLGTYYTLQALAATWTYILTAATWLWNAALAANPIVWIIALLVALVATIMLLWDKFEGFRRVIGGVFGFFKQQIMTVVHAFTNFAQIIDDIFHGRFAKAFENGKKLMNDFKNDVTTGLVDAVKKGAEAAGKSEFKFGDLLKINTGQSGPSKGFGGTDGKKGAGGVTGNAINTSKLSGANGGLGQAKIINIKIDTMQKIVTSDNKQLKARGQDAVEVMLRTVNNIAYSSSQTQ